MFLPGDSIPLEVHGLELESVGLNETVLSIADSLMRLEPVTGDPDLIRIHIHCRLDTLAIRRSIHRMIPRFIPARAVKTRRRFGSKIASFQVSVRSCAFSYLPLSVCVYILHLSFHVTFCYILPV